MARILIIEDDALLRGVLATALEQAGHTVTQAEDGLQGMTQFRARTPDLVITDLVMPVQEGIETILQISRSPTHVPVIAISGGALNADLYLTIAARIGAQQILAKPFTPQRLIERVHQVLAGAAGEPE